mmetsp:Transcript_48165/g.98384  ORF Transcript_48165/g.98384 Transcript_48165/m.98384 type:complete len:270 (-) Transcript_48165:207-1016(-)|eukprot:CAMPEP_0181323838 /NCGR_PEP_ID=MMETSP1101-20121128/20018_1 /TAXON_ID=46948 /ORGANISM="Rhodomonas abbreviata, Strain Caron Lab Isolate" /LENGTH=269 /DNA_ID=CAMNT_0023431931 /DNA_START=67 /DNA_END=876 /DNA_ORIENTATION=+
MTTSAEELHDFQTVSHGHQSNSSAEQIRHAVHFAFSMYAVDGKVQMADVAKIIKDLGMHLDNPLIEMDAIFAFLDNNQDDTISVAEFEQALEPSISKYLKKGWQLDITDILKDAFARPIKEEKHEVDLVDQAFLFAHSSMIRQNHAIGTYFWGFKWLFRMYDDFYWKAADERGHCVHASMRLPHLREHLKLVADGDEEWLNTILTVSEHQKEIPHQKARDGVHECARLWLEKLEELFDKPKKDEVAQAKEAMEQLTVVKDDETKKCVEG